MTCPQGRKPTAKVILRNWSFLGLILLWAFLLWSPCHSLALLVFFLNVFLRSINEIINVIFSANVYCLSHHTGFDGLNITYIVMTLTFTSSARLCSSTSEPCLHSSHLTSPLRCPIGDSSIRILGPWERGFCCFCSF